MLTLTVRQTIKRTLGRVFASSVTRSKEHAVDPLQEASLKESCILVDTNDNVIGQESKRNCHLVQKDGTIPLHRAFSVFIFNKKGDLLLQKRSSEKVNIYSVAEGISYLFLCKLHAFYVLRIYSNTDLI